MRDIQVHRKTEKVPGFLNFSKIKKKIFLIHL